jgi:hypothetical protein
VGHCSEKTIDRHFCAKWAVSMMRSALSPDCATGHYAGLPKSNITSFDAPSMAYAFDYGRYHFIVLHMSPRYDAPEIGIAPSMGWLARELAAATAQQRRAVLLLHAHKELRLPHDPTFARLIEGSNVAAIFYGHIHIRPWGLVGRYPNTSVPIFNCGASWYNVYCLAEFEEDGFRVAAVTHYGEGRPAWFGASLHSLAREQRAKPVLEVYVPNPNVTTWVRAAGSSRLRGGRRGAAGGAGRRQRQILPRLPRVAAAGRLRLAGAMEPARASADPNPDLPVAAPSDPAPSQVAARQHVGGYGGRPGRRCGRGRGGGGQRGRRAAPCCARHENWRG